MDNGLVKPCPQLVIFDLDGTLTDSAREVVSSFRYALDGVGISDDRVVEHVTTVAALREVLGV